MWVSNNKRYVISILLVVSVFNFTDHMIFALLMESIKAELLLSDTQLGFLSGLAFVVFYCTLGIPIARWADRSNRVTIIALSVAVWSAMTALCGMATSFFQLLLFRIGVGAGEAGCTPSSHSLIADYFSREQRPRAMSIFMMGAPLGVFFGYLLGGWINELYGWRTAFMVLGLPGVLLGLWVKLTIHEPRTASVPNAVSDNPIPKNIPPIFEIIKTLWLKRTFRHITIALSLLYFVGYGTSEWQPAFFMRTHAMQSGELGTWLAVIGGIGGAVGVWAGGYLVTRFASNNETLQLKLMALFSFLLMFSVSCIYLSPQKHLALAFLLLSNFIGMLSLGPIYALIQGLIPDSMRAMAVAVVYLIINFIGMGLGPLSVGILSDLFSSLSLADPLGYASLVIQPVCLVACIYLLRASKTVTLDLVAYDPEGSSNRAGAVDNNHEPEKRLIKNAVSSGVKAL